MNKAGFLILLSTFLLSAHAHMQLQWPPGLNSKFDPQTLQQNIDYSLSRPLDPGGRDYPCHGYAIPSVTNSLHSVGTLSSGSPFNISLAGSATHLGGSCQFAVSYDGGASFAVLASIIGACPLALGYSIQIPNLPSKSKAIFAWNWFNQVGNRESYQDCALVDVVGTAASFSAPAMFRANTLGNDCQTPAGADMVYPHPGSQIQYGGARNAQSPITEIPNCLPFQMVTLVGDGGGGGVVPSSSSTSPVSSTSTTSSTSATSITATSSTTFPAPVIPTTSISTSTSTSIVIPATSTSVPLPTSIRSSRSLSARLRSSSTATSSKTKSTSTTSTSTKAKTRTISPPSPLPPPSTIPNGLLCTSLTTFSLCDGVTCTPMGSVAAGTACRNNAIGFMKKRSIDETTDGLSKTMLLQKKNHHFGKH